MIKTILKFFRFCRPEDARKFYVSLALGVVCALLKGVRIPAIALVLEPCCDPGVELTAGRVAAAAVIMVLSLVGEGLVKARASMLQTEGGYYTASSKRIEIAEHLRYLPMGYFNESSLGRIASVATNTMENLENVATRVVMLVTEGIIVTAVIDLMMFAFDCRVACLACAGTVCVVLLSEAMQTFSAGLSARKLASDASQVEKVLEYIQGIAEVKAYGLVGERSRALNDAIDESVATNTRMEFTLIPLLAFMRFATKLVGVGICALSIWLYLGGSMSLLYCIMMIVCSYLINNALETAGSYSALLRTVDGSVDLAQDILSTPVMDVSGEKIVPAACDLAMSDVSFAYGEELVLDCVSLTVPARTTLALVGPSGSGKTTIARLLARFWDPASGTVSLGGVDERTYDLDSLMANFSFVFQDVYLFHDTIANNIRFGTPDAPAEQVEEAARQACAYDFIAELPDGFDTVIGEGGATLSGGERQRISIARAIMKDAPVIVLDEATANVDPENEVELMAAIRALTHNKTVVMIAHRLKTVRDADQILVVDHGRIVQRGRHDELATQEGIYQKFVAARAQAASWRL